jgi:hypothetical protein
MNRGATMQTIMHVLISGAVFLIASNAWSDDAERCISRAKQTNVECWDDCSSRSCMKRCDEAFVREKNQCQARISTSKKQFSGTTKSGQNGCYYGECPPDLEEQIENTEPERKKIEEEEPEPEQKPRRRDNPPLPQVTNICQTPTFWCAMNQSGPVGYPCWCATPLGTANGITVPTNR